MNVLSKLFLFVVILLASGCIDDGQKMSISVVTVCVRNDFIKVPVNSSMWFVKPERSSSDSCYEFNYEYLGDSQIVTFFYGKGRKWSQFIADGDSILVNFDASEFYNFGRGLNTQGGASAFNNELAMISLSANSMNSVIFNSDDEKDPKNIIRDRDKLLEELMALGVQMGVDESIINSLAMEIEANVYLKLKKMSWRAKSLDSLSADIDKKIQLGTKFEIGFPDAVNIYWVARFNQKCKNLETKASCYRKNNFEQSPAANYTALRYLLASEGRTPEIERIVESDVRSLPENMNYFTSKLMKEYNETPKSYQLEAYKLEGVAGQEVLFTDLANELIYVDFWATWCVPCRAEHSEWNKLEKAYRGKVSFLGVSLDEKTSYNKWLQVVDNSRLAGTQVIVDKAFDSYLPKLLNVRAIPRYAVFDRNGQVIVSSASRPGQKETEVLLDSLLANRIR